MSKPAPIIFLLGTSTAGKSTICEEISRQDEASENLGFETWGIDLESENDTERCRDLLKGNEKFEAIKDSFPDPWQVIAGVYLSEVKDAETGKILKLNNDEDFTKNLDEFLAQTGGHYDKEALETLKTLAQENPNNFREKADLSHEGMNRRAFDRAIENSKNGIPTILDMVPVLKMGDDSDLVPGGDIVEAFKAHLTEKNFTCPTHVALVHVSAKDLTERMDERNKKALAPGGNPGDQRDGIFPLKQYTALDGASAGETLGTLRQADIYQAAEKFGDENGVKIRKMSEAATEEHQSKMSGVFATLREGKKLLNQLGFEDGQTSVALGSKIKADAVYDHSGEGATAKIAEEIRGWTKEKMSEKQTESIEEKAGTFAEKYPSRKGGGGKSGNEVGGR